MDTARIELEAFDKKNRLSSMEDIVMPNLCGNDLPYEISYQDPDLFLKQNLKHISFLVRKEKNRIIEDRNLFNPSFIYGDIDDKSSSFFSKLIKIISNKEDAPAKTILLLQKENQYLLQKVSSLKLEKTIIESKNIALKSQLKKYTPDSVLRILSISFLLLFSVSIIYTVLFDYELVMLPWAKIGFIVSSVFLLMGFMAKKIYKSL